MREITFSQTHRTTGARRRFVISQSDTGAEAVMPSRKRGHRAPSSPLAWRYIAQLGDETPWTESRTLDAPGDASDEEIRKRAIRDFNRLTRAQSS
jgi:hypothetical protein